MRYGPEERITKTGLKVVLKSADPGEAQLEIDYLRRVCGETRFLLSEPEDICYTPESEAQFLKAYMDAPNMLMLNTYVDGIFIGNASFAPAGAAKRVSHRCSLGIAILNSYSGQGIGEVLITALLEQAKACGYEIMELDAVSSNARAIHLYEKLGFQAFGLRKHSMKYKDGTYADEVMMARAL